MRHRELGAAALRSTRERDTVRTVQYGFLEPFYVHERLYCYYNFGPGSGNHPRLRELLPDNYKHLRERVGDLDDGRAGDDGVVGDDLVATGENDVALAVDTGGHHDGVASVDGGGGAEDRAGNGDEGSVEGA